ncbi:unnamed protein product [Menidia menidia]|uniref:Annexin n=1 Tax=Menidia menidia TaxID=238744 RepID=A0A8S4BNJ6_9TELE|nr:unnamed protein product [Menidia menidia]
MENRGSVRPFVNFNAKHDAELLHKAMKGIGTDEDAILMLLTSRSNDQRQQIKAAYKKAYGKDLVGALKSELGGLLENLIGAGTDDQVLIEILASRTGQQIQDIIKMYKKELGGRLERDVCGDTRGSYRQLLLLLLQGNRDEGIDEEKIEKDAKISGSDIEDSIKGETTGNLEDLLLALVKCMRSVPGFFAENLYKSMRRAGTDDETLMRIMVSRSEVDMLDIRESFKRMYKQSLYSTIQEDTAGDYQKALLYLCGGND